MTDTGHSIDTGGNRLVVLAGCALLAGTVLKSNDSIADTPVCDSSTIEQALPSGADSSSVYEMFLSKDSAGNIFAVRDLDSLGTEGGWYMWNAGLSTPAWEQPPLTGTSLEGSMSLYTAKIVDGELYAMGGGIRPSQFSGSGLTWGGEVDLQATEGVYASDGFTPDFPTGRYYESRNYALTGHDSIFLNGGGAYPVISDSGSELEDPASCGDGMLYYGSIDTSGSGAFLINAYDIDAGYGSEYVISEIPDGSEPSCEYEAAGPGITTLYFTSADTAGTGYTVWSIECTHPEFAGDPDTGDTGLDDTAGGDTGTPSVDADGDGYIASSDGGDDCDDANASIHPDAAEVCDGADQNCDGTTDEGVKTTFYRDSDRDSYGDAATTTEDCSVPSGYVSNSSDCDDTAASVHPGAVETCNDTDDDCDGATDEDATDVREWHQDADGDLYGDPTTTTEACDAPVGFVSDDTDCDDLSTAVNPGAIEVCDGVDNDCVDGIDNDAADASTWYADTDRDTYGDASSSEVSCEQPGGTVSNSYDCDDSDASINPDATEVWDSEGIQVDQDCDDDTEDYSIVETTGDCEEESSTMATSGNPEHALTFKTGADCVVTLVNAEGSIDYDYAPAVDVLEPNSDLTIYWDPDEPSYTLLSDSGSFGVLSTHGTTIPVRETSFTAPSYVMVQSGSVLGYQVQQEGDDVTSIGSVIESGGVLYQNMDPEGNPTLGDPSQLKWLADLPDVGDGFTATVTPEGDIVEITSHGQKTVIDTTNPDTGPDTGVNPDTGEPPPPDEGCGSGCSVLKTGNPDLMRGAFGTQMLFVLGGLASWISRRRNGSK